MFAIVGLCAISGCLHRTGVIPSPADRIPVEPRVTLAAGDEVEVRFFATPELNVQQVVRRDGKVSLQLIGDVVVRGRTPDEVRLTLQELYESQLKHPQITVVVRSSLNDRIFVGGEVNTPGALAMPGSMTLLEAVMQAGGFDFETAEVRNVVVIRHTADGRFGYSVDLLAAIEGEVTRPFYLAPQDIVFVPRTTIVRVDQWIDQYINQIVPKTGFSYSSASGGVTTGIDTGVR